MKLDEGDMIAGVEICTERTTCMLTTAQGQCIRFPVNDVRVFKGRDSTGVRGIRLEDGDHVISMSILRHVEATADERAAFLKMSRAVAGEETEAGVSDEETAADATLSPGALCRDGRGRAGDPDRLVQRLWQAHVVLRVPHHRPRRQRHRRHGGE